MTLSILWNIVSSPWYWFCLGIAILVSFAVTPDRIGQVACHWGLHDTLAINPGEWQCTRCRAHGSLR